MVYMIHYSLLATRIFKGMFYSCYHSIGTIGEGGDELQKDIWLILMEKLRGIHCLIIKTIKKPENK